MVRITATKRGMDIIVHHVANLKLAFRLLEHLPRHGGGNDFRNMLVLGDGRHFLLRQTTQSDAVLKTDHAILPNSTVDGAKPLRTLRRCDRGKGGAEGAQFDHEAEPFGARFSAIAMTEQERAVKCTVPDRDRCGPTVAALSLQFHLKICIDAVSTARLLPY